MRLSVLAYILAHMLAGVLADVLLANETTEAQHLQHYPDLDNLTCVDVKPAERAPRSVSVHGEIRDLTLYWNSGPARAAASILLLMLRVSLNYSDVTLQSGPLDLCDLHPKKKELVVVPAAMLTEHNRCNLYGEGILVIHEAVAPLTLRPHVLLTEAARSDAACTLARIPIFYRNVSALRHCGFLDHNEELSELFALVPRFTKKEKMQAVKMLQQLSLEEQRVGRANLTDLIMAAKRSFVFVDYEIWSDVSGVVSVPLPPFGADSRYVSVFAASQALSNFATSLSDVLTNFSVKSLEIRDLLEAEENPDDYKRVICQTVKNAISRVPQRRHDHWMAVVVCQNDPYHNLYGSIAHKVGLMLWNITYHSTIIYGIAITQYKVNCSNTDVVSEKLTDIAKSSDWYRCVGVVVPAEGVKSAAKTAKHIRMPLVAYGTPADAVYDTGAVPGAGAPAGVAPQLAPVVSEFLKQHKWKRLAVLSELSSTAKTLSEALTADSELTVRAITLSDWANSSERKSVLTELSSNKARIFLVNGGWSMARAVLATAAELGLTAAGEYAWLAREWRGAALPGAGRLVTISFDCNATDSFADAILSLGAAFASSVRHTERYRDDLRSEDAYRDFWETFNRINETGLCQTSLRYREGALLAPLVFVHEITANATRRLATWTQCANCSAGVQPLGETLDPYDDENTPLDGTTFCWWSYGDKFMPVCLEYTVFSWGGALVLLLTLASTVICTLKRRADRRRALRLLSEEFQKRKQRERIVSTLVDKLVDREALELREHIGSGRFGRVWLAVLRGSGRRPRAVAAKALHDDAAPAEESEFLREACTLATLEHKHVVRLLGVCATGGPPLILMEHAYFGDLERYLRARRHLAEASAGPAEAEAEAEAEADAEAEAEHVSAGELTRLAREAAAALGYLAHRGLVHRDVRAANCLVDAHRTLKLGDFGMARETCVQGAEGETVYACQRRGIFPVLWMAPESLARGAFSSASDVWAFGVLALEMMTLGERPYGSWPPPRVLHHVLQGGRPRLPADAGAQARGLTLACWRQRAAERPTAADLVAYLAEHPRVLAPALAPFEELGSLDSGFCESPTLV